MVNETITATKSKGKQRPSTERTRKLKEAYLGSKPSICADRSVLVTESYKETEALTPALRQAMAFEKVLNGVPIWIQDEELLVGNIASRPRGVFLFPEYDETWLEPELDTISARQGDPWILSDEDKDMLKSSLKYWPGKNMASIADALTTDEVRKAEKVTFLDIQMAKQGGIGHIAPDIEGVVKRGLNSMIAEAEEHIKRLDPASPEYYTKVPFLKSMIIADKAVINWARRFADLARQKASVEADPRRKAELEQIAETCEWVPANPARNLREALQTVVFIMDSVQIETNGVSIGTGRLDQYCYPFYEKDIREGLITREEAMELLECLWLKIAESNRTAPELLTYAHNGYPFWIQLPIGGQTRDGYDATNDLSYLLLEVSSNMLLHEPTVSARIHKKTPDKFLMKCCEAIKAHGGGHPALFNDEVIIPSQLAYVPGITKEDAYDYCIIGCSEIVFAGKGTEGIPYHAMSLGRLIELMLQARDPVSGNPLPSDLGDMLTWNTYEDMLDVFNEVAKRFALAMFLQQLPMVEAHANHRPCPYLSSLTHDCIGRGLSYYNGGGIYGNRASIACIVGIATMANSMAAVRKLVFDDKAITMSQLQHALNTNFEDTTTTPTGPEIQEMCMRAPKYGNDDPYVDNITKDCLNVILKELRSHETIPGQGYGATIAPVAAHMGYGLLCGATPDGRKAMTPLSDACSPAQGTDVNGPTATIKSVASLEHVNVVQGTIFNMKMHPGPLQTKAGMKKWADMIRTFFDLGGWEIQFNVVDADTLRDAQVHPESYKDLVVRVVGYSAYFVELDKSVQDDIISRTEHAV